MSEFTGKGRTSDFESKSYEEISTSISPVFKFLLTVSRDLLTTEPFIFTTLSLVSLFISLKNSLADWGATSRPSVMRCRITGTS